jgi:glutamyl-tRNA reductase
MSDALGSNKFRFALVGAGIIGTHHGKVISELDDQIDLVAVVNRTLDKAEKITAVRGGTAFTQDRCYGGDRHRRRRHLHTGWRPYRGGD